MTLLFQRIAHNFAKNGYYPTDSATLARTLGALAPCQQGRMRIIDPCCGEGTALAECSYHLGRERTSSYGIEYDEERSNQGKQLLDVCIHGDIQNCVVGARQFNLLWLNPPYGDLVKDSLGNSSLADRWKGRKRLEKMFYYLSHHYLQKGGVMVLIIPYTCLDSELSGWIAKHFDTVKAYLAPEQRFKQLVLFGVKRRSQSMIGSSETKTYLEAIAEGELPPELPMKWEDEPYTVPAATSQNSVTFKSVRIDEKQLEHVWDNHTGLWQQFQSTFMQSTQPHRRPLMPLSNWHLSLVLAAGQVAGVISANDGRVFAIKGDTYKSKDTIIEREEDKDGNITETRILVDKFVPAIRAIDFTPESPSYGDIVTIR